MKCAMKKYMNIVSVCFGFLSSLVFAQEDKTLLKIGDVAPEFSLQGSDGVVHSLSEFKGKKHVVLIFYPGDDTPGCTSQLCALRDDASLFATKNAVIFGINPANQKSHLKFVEKFKFPFPLLVDSTSHVTSAYGASGAMMVKRTVYVVGLDGTIIFAQRGKPENTLILKAIP